MVIRSVVIIRLRVEETTNINKLNNPNVKNKPFKMKVQAMRVIAPAMKTKCLGHKMNLF